MLTAEAMGNLAAEMTDAQTHGDAESLAAIAWQLYGEVGEDLAEIGRLRAAIHAAWSQPQGKRRHQQRPRPELTAGAKSDPPEQQGHLAVTTIEKATQRTRSFIHKPG